MRALPLLAFLLSTLVVGCGIGMKPHTPRVARSAGHELALGTVRPTNPLSDPGSGAQRIRLHVAALPENTRVSWVAISEAARAPCSEGYVALNVRLAGRAWSTPEWRPRPGDILELDFNEAAWTKAVTGPSRLDVLLEADDGVTQCASFPLVDERPEQRWDPLERWTLNTGVEAEGLRQHVAGFRNVGGWLFEVGRFLGPLRVYGSVGVGTAECAKSACPQRRNKQTNKYENREALYLPFAGGAELTLAQYKFLALDLKAHYRLAFARATTYDGVSRTLLHGPMLLPALVITMPDPIAPGIPGGVRRGMSVSLEGSVSYLWSSSGDGSLGVGGGFMIQFPIH